MIYILADDLGYGELGSYGQEKIRTPNLDRLASEGMRFTQHYSGSAVCAPSRCVLLTGRHSGRAIVRDNWENGGWGPDEPEGQYPLPTGTPGLGRSLQQAGYATAAVGKWGLGGPGTSGRPNAQGFDLFFGYLCQRKAHNYYPTHLWRNDEKVPLPGNEEYFRAHQKIEAPLEDEAEYAQRFARETYACDPMIEEALGFVRANAEEPFFLYYASPVPHLALQIPEADVAAYPEEWDPEPYLGQKGYLPHPSPRRAYAAMITRLDTEVGRLLTLLEELGLEQDTIVMFSSDNGVTYTGGVEAEFFDSTAGLRGRKGSLFEGGIRVPFLARWPGRIAAGSTSDHPSAFHDVFPTILELVGLELPEEIPIDGLSLAPTLLGEGEQSAHPYLYWEFGPRQALRMGRWKALRRHLGEGDLTIELFDLERDPPESIDRAADEPEVTARCAELMAEAHTPSEAFPLATIDS